MVSLLLIVGSDEVSPVLPALLGRASCGGVYEREPLRCLREELGQFNYYLAARKNSVTGLG